MKDLRKTFQLIALLSLIQVGVIETVSGQHSSIRDTNCICYTDAMDIKAITCLRAAPIKDSIIQNDMLQILNLKERMLMLGEKSDTFETSYTEEKELTKSLTADLIKSKAWNKKILIGGPLIGLLVGILISN